MTANEVENKIREEIFDSLKNFEPEEPKRYKGTRNGIVLFYINQHILK